jgi:hypothetical protein
VEFIASPFYNFLRRPDALKVAPFALIYEIISHGSQSFESEARFSGFMRKGAETAREMFGLQKLVRLEYCWTEWKKDFFDVYFQSLRRSEWRELGKSAVARRRKSMRQDRQALIGAILFMFQRIIGWKEAGNGKDKHEGQRTRK